MNTGRFAAPLNKPKDMENTMRLIFKALVKELGQKEGAETFEWYCRTYNVTITDPIPATVYREVLGY